MSIKLKQYLLVALLFILAFCLFSFFYSKKEISYSGTFVSANESARRV